MKLRIIVLLTLLLALSACAQRVEQGDNVTVIYTGRYANGTIFDTNNVITAKDANIYNPEREYKPIVVHLGKHEVVPGFEKALIGMRPGEEKRVTLSPSEAYGEYNPGKVSTLNRVETNKRYAVVPRTVKVPDTVLRKGHPTAKIGDTIRQGNSTYRFIKIENDSDILLLLKKPGEKLRLPNIPWPLTILKVENETFFTRQDPVNGSIVTTELGPALVTINDKNISMKLTPPIGAKYKTKAGIGRVVGVNNNSISVDFNPPLAGKNLTFEIKLLRIEK